MMPAFSDAVFWIAVVACAVAQAGIVRSVLVARPPAGPQAAAGRRAAEVAWAAAPAVALALVFVLTWRAIHGGAA